MKYILSILLFCLQTGFLFAQQEEDRTIFKAMQDEIERNSEQLALPGMPQPYYISYTLGQSHQFKVAGSLGGITESFETPLLSLGGTEVFTGSYERNSNLYYISNPLPVEMPRRADYNMIRRNFWLATDMAYKWTLQNGAAKDAFLNANPRTPEESKLKDQLKMAAVNRIENTAFTSTINRFALEETIRELSAVFKDYKDIYNSSVIINGVETNIYKYTTDSVVLKQPLRCVSLYVTAYVVTDDGYRINDSFSVLGAGLEDLPPLEESRKRIRTFADNLIKLRNAPVIGDFYTGPVLFEETACMSLFVDQLLKPGHLLAYRKPDIAQDWNQPTLDSRMNTRIIDPHLTIKNYSSLDRYNGEPLLGAYTIDAEGVIPPKETTLVEKGILKAILSGGVPTLQAPISTGSSRFLIFGRNGAYTTAPGTIHIQAEKGTEPEKMKKALLRAAREKGLLYAYIVRSMSGNASRIYRVDLKDGQETQVRLGTVTGINLSKIERILEISNQEKVSNYILNRSTLSSLIYPSAILLEDIEIHKAKMKKEKQQVLTFPLQR